MSNFQRQKEEKEEKQQIYGYIPMSLYSALQLKVKKEETTISQAVEMGMYWYIQQYESDKSIQRIHQKNLKIYEISCNFDTIFDDFEQKNAIFHEKLMKFHHFLVLFGDRTDKYLLNSIANKLSDLSIVLIETDRILFDEIKPTLNLIFKNKHFKASMDLVPDEDIKEVS